MKVNGMKVMMVTGVAAFVLTTGLIGTYFVSQAHPDEFTVVESGIINEKEPQLMNLSSIKNENSIENIENSSGDLSETYVSRNPDASEIQYANAKTEDEWTTLAAEALNNFFDVDVSSLKSSYSVLPAIDKYDLKESISILFSENPDDVMNTDFYSVIIDPQKGTVEEVYDIFSNTSGGTKVVETSVTVDEARKMAEEFITSKDLAKAENMEYIGGKVTSEGRIHVSFNVGNDTSISVGIDTYTNEIKSFFTRDLEYGKNMIFSKPEDAVG